jgi:hypothetical protein
MHRDKGFAPLAAIIVLILIAMVLANCDARYATGAVRQLPTQTEGTP